MSEEKTPKDSKASFSEKILPVVLVAVVGLAFAVGVLWQKIANLESGGTKKPTAQATQPAKPAIKIEQIKELFKKDLVKFGDENRKVLFVEVSDPSCPYCHIAAGLDPEISTGQFLYKSKGGSYIPPIPEMKRLVDEGKASLVHIYSPGHGNGEMAAKALYCAFEQGRYWQAHELLMTNAGYTLINETVKNDKAQTQTLVDYLKKAVDGTKLKVCLDSGKYDDRLASDTQLAASLGVSGTPGFYVNTTNFAGAYSWKEMESVVQEALK